MCSVRTSNSATTYGRIKTDNSTAANSKALADIEALAKTWNYEEFERRAAAGQSVVWGGSSWEAPLLRACDTLRGELGEASGASAIHRRIRVEELVKKTGARGIINTIITACPYASVVQQLERNYFKKQGIPMVALEGTVHSDPPTEEQIMKVRTFIDMLS
jgi:hypothetical protein